MTIAKTFEAEGNLHLAKLWGIRGYEDWHSAVTSFAEQMGLDVKAASIRFPGALEVERETSRWVPNSELEQSSSSEFPNSAAQR